jgi:nitrite reductase/ring-hydroxylating ferredoxin subunit
VAPDVTKTLVDAVEPLEPVADALQAAAKAIPKPIRDVLDGVWFGNPLHPALTDVPVGAWTAAFLLDLADADDAADAALAIGALAAVPTALTGLNDWSHLRGETKRLGFVHALLNGGALVLNVASLALRRSGARGAGRALSTLAFGAASFSAHLGGHLSYEYGVRVNRTAWDEPHDRFAAVLDESELEGGKLCKVDLDGVDVLVTRSEQSGEVCAIANVCTHLGGPLSEGERDGDSVVCPWHGSRFDLCTGAVEGGPAVYAEPRFEARIRGGKVEIRAAHEG